LPFAPAGAPKKSSALAAASGEYRCSSDALTDKVQLKRPILHFPQGTPSMNDVKRPSLREAAKRGAEANRREREVAPPKPTSAPAKPAAEVAKATAACGHEVDVGPCKPAFIAQRAKQLAGQPCSDCKQKAQQERETAEREAARKRREEKASEPRREKPRPHIARLPHGATFHLRYDAEAVRWSGTLTIPAPGSGIFKESVVSADDGAVFALLQRLDRKYRGMEEEGPAAELAAVASKQPLP
jgi:hypothetical protein